MSEKEYSNGLYKSFTELQESRFEDLKTTVKTGFENLASELRQSREQGHIPVPVFLTVIKVISWPYIIVIIFLTGVKYLPSLFGG
jgi:hypothetical protein